MDIILSVFISNSSIVSCKNSLIMQSSECVCLHMYQRVLLPISYTARFPRTLVPNMHLYTWKHKYSIYSLFKATNGGRITMLLMTTANFNMSLTQRLLLTNLSLATFQSNYQTPAGSKCCSSNAVATILYQIVDHRDECY